MYRYRPKEGVENVASHRIGNRSGERLAFLAISSSQSRSKVIILSGESGMAVLQETARRICKAMGVCLSELDNLLWSDFLLDSIILNTWPCFSADCERRVAKS